VENKIGTDDHADQLNDYRSWLNEPRRRSFKTRLLLYLTPAGDLAKNARRKIYEPISYSEYISRWLRSCLDEVNPARVKEAIKTYLLTISNLNTNTLMKDDLDGRILNLIKTPADQTAALRIARVCESLKEKILQKVWDKGEDYLRKKLTDEKLTYWSLDRAKGSTLQSRYWIALTVKGLDEEIPQAQFSFFQFNTTTLFRWELAVKFDGWRGKHEKITALPEAQKLAAVMDGTFSMPKKHGWDGYCLYTADSKGIERFLEDEIEKLADVSDFFEAGWKKFQGLEPHLKRLNNVILRQIR